MRRMQLLFLTRFAARTLRHTGLQRCSCHVYDAPALHEIVLWRAKAGVRRHMYDLLLCSSTMAASSVQEQDLIVLGRRPQAPQQPQQQAASSAADPQQARMQAAMRTRPDGSLENVQASLILQFSHVASI